MKKFANGGKKSFGAPFAKKSFGAPEMFRAVCGECGRSCEVPFRPSGSKPVYCSDCFKTQKPERRDFDRPSFRRQGEDNRRDERRDFDRPSFRRQGDGDSVLAGKVAALEDKLDKIISLLSQPKEALKEKKDEMTDKDDKKPVRVTAVKKVAVKKTTSGKKLKK